ncbi:MAG: oxygen-independent coproporphyrinogen III oxidase [Prevotellaceae bacterium]|nr:oxygen-independent coproporphyrinogen III oxidase [Prevotellaceae bacterium]
MEDALLLKYNRPVPRYTSYPPATSFRPLTETEYRQVLTASNGVRQGNLSFYLHIPFCRQLCLYCGCNSQAMPSGQILEAYVQALHREIDLVADLLDADRRVAQIHYGGGTPTVLPAGELRRLNDHLLARFAPIGRPEIAIECHPGYLMKADWEALLRAGFNRFSIGVQDFDPRVLGCVHRRPPLRPLEETVEVLRGAGAGINLDLLYGLPLQTTDSFARTLDRAIALHPDRLVTFSYAHVPWVNPRQRLLEEAGLPDGTLKNALFETAASRLAGAGYRRIGMDHFVLPDDELHLALQSGQLHRNFQGYCTRRTTAQVYAFGPTGISQLEGAYVQNGREVDEYLRRTAAGRLYPQRGYLLGRDERLTGAAIEALMCNYRLDWDALAARLGITAPELQAATAYRPERLRPLADDGLIRFDEHQLVVLPAGIPFVRIIASLLDGMMEQGGEHFSKPI